MDTHIFHSTDLDVGQVFTPLRWAEWLINRWCVFDAWIDGARICDPTAGQGAFALAMLQIAKIRNVSITPDLLSRLKLIELYPSNLAIFRVRANQEFGVNFPDSCLVTRDVTTITKDQDYDILIGNPPWSNFVDLPPAYKEYLKPFFLAEGLVQDRRQTLLGSSRTDIAALVLKIVLGKLLRKNGVGYFYVPLSLFSGDNAHVGFRDYRANNRKFAVEELYEFTSTKIFHGISTSYCCVRIRMDVPQEFPVKYLRELDGQWIEHKAVPLREPEDQWRVVQDIDDLKTEVIEIQLSAQQKPRQGVNTCGANSIFIFNHEPAHIPKKFLFPLATKEMWKEQPPTPRRWILLPYDRVTGKPLSWQQIEHIKGLRDYLEEARSVLKMRKGILIRSAIEKGIWWSLLGVGPYSFSPYKVMWEAYGKSYFNPIILHEADGQIWQGNQAMHAFIPCWSERDAKRILSELQNPAISVLLSQINGSGKRNWAQPGKMKKILSFQEPLATPASALQRKVKRP